MVASETFLQQSDSKFLALPPEIRNRIYETVLHIEPTIYAGGHSCVSIRPSGPPYVHRQNPKWQPSSPSVLELLLTCRQVRDEAEGLFYSINHLEYVAECVDNSSLGKLYSKLGETPSPPFLKCIGSRRLKAIETLTITALNTETALQEVRELRRVPNLKVLHFRLPPLMRPRDDVVAGRATAMGLELGRMKKLREVKVILPTRLDQSQRSKARERQAKGLRRLRLLEVTMQSAIRRHTAGY